jgi:hypothetical protein
MLRHGLMLVWGCMNFRGRYLKGAVRGPGYGSPIRLIFLKILYL